jgi:hypothetical protein
VQSEDDPSWDAYPHTILEFHAGQTVRIDLRQSVTAAAHAALTAIGLNQPFAVLTAFNPTGQMIDEAANRRRTEALRQRLTDRGLLVIPTHGVSPDRSHRETGFAVAIPQEEATGIAKEFGQSAMFWWDGTRFWIHSALVSYPPRPLPDAAQQP